MAAVQHEKASQRMVPSGKVYRQIFEAEVQLVKSLENRKLARHGNSIQNRGIKQAGIPVVHTKLPEAGMLDSRQIHWLEEFPNEPYTENPIVYKFYHDEERSRMKETDRSVEAKEVLGLPDVIVPAKVGSNVIERIAASRRQRHEAALEDMYHELGLISTEIEPRLIFLSERLMKSIDENDIAVENIMSEIMSDEMLQTTKMSLLQYVWENVAAQMSFRKDCIVELDVNVGQLEKLRMEKVRKVFEDTAVSLEKIGHLVLPDLQRLLDRECQLVNQTVLSNKRAYADLHARLMMATLEQEKKVYLQWKKQVDHWRKIHEDDIIERFKSFMFTEDVVNPPSASKIVDEMIERLNNLNQKRIDAVFSLRVLQPPASTKTAVTQLHQEIVDISREIGSVNQLYFNKLCAEYERICQSCLKEVDRVKMELIERELCTNKNVTEVITAHCLPLIGEQQAKYEQLMEEIDKSLEEHSACVLGRLKVMFNFCLEAAHLWDLHEIGLARRERELKEKLEEVRLQNEIINQESESNLDALLDRLRQGPTELALQEDWKKVLAVLDAIHNRYTAFHGDQSKVVAEYPESVQAELSAYDKSLCLFFGIESFGELSEEKTPAETETDSRILITENGTKYQLVDDKREGDSARGEDVSHRQQLSTEEESQEKESDSHTFSAEARTEVKKTEEKELASYLQSVDVSDQLVKQVMNQMRMNMLNHLDMWKLEAMERSNVVVEAKNAELQKEFDLHVRLHEPRARRVELDIHNVRAAELVMHSERILSHFKGAEEAMAELKLKCSALTEDHNKMAEKFTKDIDQLETVFLNATKSSKLTELSHQLSVVQEKFMEQIRTSIRQFGQHLDRNIQMLHQSTAQLIKSFKLFSEGGNFCPAEVEEFRSRLNRLSSKINHCEGSIMGSLESIESKRLDQALKVTRDFEDRYKYHMVDLVFLEKIARWLTNTQVKIKTEVALSNSASKGIADLMQKFEKRLDACERPNPDKEHVIPSSLVSDLVAIYEAVQKRSIFLHCLKDPLSVSSSAISLQGSPALGARIALATEGLNCISKPGKHQLDDPSIGIIKNILRNQKATGSEGLATNGKENLSANSVKSKKAGSKDGPRKSRLISGKGKIDKKYFVFGETAEEGEENCFLGRIKQILRPMLEALLTASEIFYRQKGIRSVTRPDVLKDSFDDCADILVQKCQSYFSQSEDYHNECLQEFRQQLSQLETLAGRVPPVILKDLESHALKKIQAQLKQTEEEFAQKAKENCLAKEMHDQELRPGLGHPQQQNLLDDLRRKEEERQNISISDINQHAQLLKNIIHEKAEGFLQELARTSENLFVQFDDMLIIDEVQSGRQLTLTLSTDDLLRRHKEGQPLESKVALVEVARGRNTWPGISTEKMMLVTLSSTRIEVKSRKVEESANMRTASVTTAKTTLGHKATIEARDKTYERFKTYILSTLTTVNDDREKRTVAEERWSERWKVAVEKVQQLYQ